MAAPEPLSVLIVDDDHASVDFLGSHLRAAGYDVLTARDGREALSILLSTGTPIVLTNWEMPRMDGLEFCRTVRAHEAIPFAYIILVSAVDRTEETVVAALEAGVDELISKPVNVRELVARVRAGARIAQLQQSLSLRQLDLHRVNAEQAMVNEKLVDANERLERLATLDSLTGLYNRRIGLDRLQEAWLAGERRCDALSCILVDIDHFKSFNDVYGHDVGDQVLREVAASFREAVRKDETLCRFGGEEFLVVCPRTRERQADVAAERLRRAIDTKAINIGETVVKVTASFGVAERCSTTESPEALLREADRALYAAKDQGRNCVRTASSITAQERPRTVAGIVFQHARDLEDGAFSPEEPAQVIVADNDPSSRALCRAFLTSAGYDVVEAENGKKTLEHVSHSPPDVILMELNMPEMDGLGCTRILKADPIYRHIPIIMTSSRSNGSNILAALSAGADEFLTKPYPAKELALRVRSMVRLHRQLNSSNAVRGEQSRALGLLSDLSRSLAAADSLSEVLQRTVDATASLTCARNVALLLPDTDRNFLRVACSIGLEEKFQNGEKIPVATSLIGSVFSSTEPLILALDDPLARSRIPEETAIFPELPAMITALSAPEAVVGALTISDRQDRRPFSPSDLEYVELIGNIAASAIHERLTQRALEEARFSIVLALARLAEQRDSDTGKHVDRVTRFCLLLARELGRNPRFRNVIDDAFLADLERAAPLHDIGKVAVPDHILRKPGALSESERAIMRNHADIGARTIRSVVERVPDVTFLRMAEDIAFAHHEWYDGGGYPRQLAADQIPLPARIAAVADVYDAITTRRVYKEAISHSRAVEIIQGGAGRQFDPDVVDAFVAVEKAFENLAAELSDEGPPEETVPEPAASRARLVVAH